MRLKIELLHHCLGNCRAVADFLGYSLRGYMAVRRQIFSGGTVSERAQAMIEQKLSELLGRRKTKILQGVASVAIHKKSKKTDKVSPCRKEFDKARRKIKSMLLAGKSRMAIHKHLTRAGRLTQSYSGFCRLISREIANDPSFLAR